MREFGHRYSITATEVCASLVQNVSKSEKSLSVTTIPSAKKVMKSMCDWHCFFFISGKVPVQLAMGNG